MSDRRRLDGEKVFCYQCGNESGRSRGCLQCPRCEGEFVEILPPGNTHFDDHDSNISEPSSPILSHHSTDDRLLPLECSFNDHFMNDLGPFHDHNPCMDAPGRDEADISTFQFRTPGGGRGTLSITSRLYTSRTPLNARRPGGPAMFAFGPPSTFGVFETQSTGFGRDPHSTAGPGEMQDLFSIILSNAFDGILGQLAEHGNAGPPPASEAAIKAVPRKKIDKSMFGENGKAECSICMDNVELGAEVMILPCNHWFHVDCVVIWLKEHDTCPHCRKPITNPQDQPAESSRRRSSRRSSSVASAYGADRSRDYPVPDAQSALRAARQRYYSSRDEPERDRPPLPSRSGTLNQRAEGGQYYDGRHESIENCASRPDHGRHHRWKFLRGGWENLQTLFQS